MGGFKTNVDISCRLFHLAIAVPDSGKHEPFLTSDAGLDPKAHLLELFPDAQTCPDLPGLDQDSDGGVRGKEWR